MSRLWLLKCLVVVMILLGLATLNGGLMALAIPLFVYAVSCLFQGSPSVQLSAARALSAERVTAGEPVGVRLRITNLGPTVEELQIADVVPQPLELLEGQTCALTTLLPGATIEMEYRVRAKRGLLEFGDLRVRARDHLGLCETHVVLSAPAQLLVLPEVPKLRSVAIRPRRTHGFAGPIPARQPGTGVDFLGIRAYQPGDPQRWINWRVSARHTQTLFSNQFEQERITDVGLILDTRRHSNLHSNGKALFEHAVCATAALAEAFLKEGHRVGLLLYGYGMERTFPGYGRLQRQRLLNALARAKTGMNYALESLDRLPTRFFPAQSQLVIVSPLSPEDVPTLISLRAHGYEILAICPDAVSFELAGRDPSSRSGLAARLARIERTLWLRSLQRVGIRVVDWQVDQALDQAVHMVLQGQPIGRVVWELAA